VFTNFAGLPMVVAAQPGKPRGQVEIPTSRRGQVFLKILMVEYVWLQPGMFDWKFSNLACLIVWHRFFFFSFPNNHGDFPASQVAGEYTSANPLLLISNDVKCHQNYWFIIASNHCLAPIYTSTRDLNIPVMGVYQCFSRKSCAQYSSFCPWHPHEFPYCGV
jgi:hypothetical protein